MNFNNKKFLLSIIIPVFNEERTILEAINTVRDIPYEKEIVVVDDNSTDNTRKILQSINSPEIKIYYNQSNTGKGGAVRKGIANATGDIFVIQDADLEYNPQELSILLEPILSGKADVVFGSRFSGHGAHRVLYFWHSVGNKFLTLLSNVFTGLNLTDMETCYKMMTRNALEGISIKENRFGFEPEMTAKLAKKKLRIYEVPISYYGRTYEEGKKINWRDGIAALWCIIKYNIQRK